ncbi:hypothetical protein KEM56_001977 [Ascosphaera pollenicola]|nr:hypothetical protein KEM56_001977 [Ascosphaera pollenicola]
MAQNAHDLRPQRAPDRNASALTEVEEQEIKENFEARFPKALASDITAEERLSLCIDLRDDIHRLWTSNSNYFRDASQAIATASRNESWRAAFGRSRILDFYSSLLSTPGGENDLVVLALKIVSNSCAEMPENRIRIFEWHYDIALLRLLEKKSLCGIVIVVIYNLCCEFTGYEEARKILAKHGLVQAVLKVLLSDWLSDEDYQEYAYNLLDYGSAMDISSSPDDSLKLLLDLADKPNQTRDSYISQVNVICAHLEDDRFKKACIEQDLFSRALDLLPKSHRFPPASSDPEEAKRLANARLVLNQVFSDISDQSDFVTTYPLGSPVSQKLISWLGRSEADMITCSCIVLGNLARDDTVCEELVKTHQAHVKLIDIVEREKSKASVAYSALGFLKNLAVPINNRELLGSAGLFRASSLFWKFASLPQLQMTAISGTRLAIANCFQNTTRMFGPSESEKEKTYISLLLEVRNTTDQKPVKIETARAVAAIIRNIGLQKGTPQADEATELADRLLISHNDLDSPISCLLENRESSLIQGEGVIALTMLAQSREGAKIAATCLNREAVFNALRDIMENPIDDALNVNEKKSKTSNRANCTLLYHYLTQMKVR